jgi:hypothetical protein
MCRVLFCQLHCDFVFWLFEPESNKRTYHTFKLSNSIKVYVLCTVLACLTPCEICDLAKAGLLADRGATIEFEPLATGAVEDTVATAWVCAKEGEKRGLESHLSGAGITQMSIA